MFNVHYRSDNSGVRVLLRATASSLWITTTCRRHVINNSKFNRKHDDDDE